MLINKNEYQKIHRWIRKNYGKADKCENLECLKKSENYEWAKIKEKEYERKRENFQQLCHKCHKKYDYTEETRKKIKEIAKMYFSNFENRKKLSLLKMGKPTWNKGICQWKNKTHPRLGKKHSEKTKLKMRESRFVFYKNGGKNTLSMLGKHHTEERKKRQSEIMKGRKFTKEHKNKISLAMTGNKNGMKKLCPFFKLKIAREA